MASLEDHAQVKVIDFGLAVETHGKDITQASGSPFYLAPEVIECAHATIAKESKPYGESL